MAAGLSTANTANPLLDTFRGLPFDVDNLYLQLHTGDPGSAGTSNVSAVTSRQQVTLGASALGVLTVTNIPAFLMTATETITHVSLWSASSGGTFHISGALVAERPVVSGDFVVFNQITIAFTPLAA